MYKLFHFTRMFTVLFCVTMMCGMRQDTIPLRLKDKSLVSLASWKENEFIIVLEKNFLKKKLNIDANTPIFLPQVCLQGFRLCDNAIEKRSEKSFKEYFNPLTPAQQNLFITTAGSLNAVSLLYRLWLRCLPSDLIKNYFLPQMTKPIVEYLKYKVISTNENGKELFSLPCIEKKSNTRLDSFFSDGSYSITSEYTSVNCDGVCIIQQNSKGDAILARKKGNISYEVVSTPSIVNGIEDFVLYKNSDNALVLTRLDGHFDPIVGTVFSDDDHYLITYSRGIENNVVLWNLEKNEGESVEPLFLVGHEQPITAICFNHQATLVVSACEGIDNNLKLWDMSGNCIATLEGHHKRIHTLQCNNDGTRLLSCSSDFKTWKAEIILWDVADAAHSHCVRAIQLDANSIAKAKFTPTGEKIAVLCTNGKLLILNGKTGKKLVESSWCYLKNVRHTLRCQGIVFSSDERYCVVLRKDVASNSVNIEMRDICNGSFIMHYSAGVGDIVINCISLSDRQLIADKNNGRTILFELYNAVHEKSFNWIENQANALQLYALYRLYKAADYKQKVCFDKRESVYHELKELTASSMIKDMIKKHLPSYNPPVKKSHRVTADACRQFLTMSSGF